VIGRHVVEIAAAAIVPSYRAKAAARLAACNPKISNTLLDTGLLRHDIRNSETNM
jgi:hypothetical protein